MNKYVLIGGSIACAGAIAGIKSVEKNADITVVCGEKLPLYSRPLISYYLEGKTTEENLFYKGKDFYIKNNIKIKNNKAERIDSKEKVVVLDNDEKIKYDKLLVSTGSYPFVPPMKGLDTVPYKQCFYTMEDVKNLQKHLKSGSKVLIIGAGLIGLKCAEGLYPTTHDITIVDLQNRVLPNVTTPKVAEIIRKHLEDKGFKFEFETSVSEFNQNNATLGNGKTLNFDILILAIGVRPNVSLIKDIGGEVNRGIIVDEYMQTSIEDVYSAGDCVEGYEAVSMQKRLLQLFPSAYSGGLCAGKNMAGEKEEFKTDVPLNSTKLLGMSIMSCGVYDGDLIEDSSNGYKALFIKDNKLNGYIIVNDIERAGIYTSLISKRIDLSTIDKDLMIKSPQLIAFDKNIRQKMLGGEV